MEWTPPPGGVFARTVAQKLPQRDRVPAPPRDAPLRADPLQVSHHQHPEVHARRKARLTHPLRVALPARLLRELVEAAPAQKLVQSRVERVVQRPHRAGRDEELLLPRPGHSAYSHRRRLPPRSLYALKLTPRPEARRNRLYPRTARALSRWSVLFDRGQVTAQPITTRALSGEERTKGHRVLGFQAECVRGYAFFMNLSSVGEIRVFRGTEKSPSVRLFGTG